MAKPNKKLETPRLTIRRADERGHAEHGWLNTFHTFSFAGYFDPSFMGFRNLRVLNEDRVQPGEGFPPHSHRDMEIISYVLEGQIAHRDSMGNGSTVRPGEFQRMSAGTGVQHSEYNASKTEPLHFLQIWIIPEQNGLPPSYEQKVFPASERTGQLRLVASRDSREGSIKIHQDVNLYSGILNPGQSLTDRLPDDRSAWIHVVRGVLTVNGQVMSAGDGASLTGGGPLELMTPIDGATAEVLLFDLA